VGNNQGQEKTDALAALERGLRTELTLLDDLIRGLLEQRSAIGADDTPTLEQLVQHLSRTLLTLREARRQRRILVELLTGEAEAGLGSLLASTAEPESPELATLCRQLRERAAAANRELAVNQAVIRRAIHSGERFLQQLLTAPHVDLYRNRPDAEVPGGLLLNQRA
jgi:hypothetical protein